MEIIWTDRLVVVPVPPGYVLEGPWEEMKEQLAEVCEDNILWHLTPHNCCFRRADRAAFEANDYIYLGHILCRMELVNLESGQTLSLNPFAP